MELSREQLNRQARLLAERAELLSEGLTISSVTSSVRDEEGEGQLRTDCRLLQDRIKQMKDECRQLPELPNEDSPLALLLEHRRVQAELNVWQKQSAEVLSTRSSVVEAATRHKLEENVTELVETLSVVRGHKTAATKRLEKEQKLLEESKDIEKALRERISILEDESNSTGDARHGEDEVSKQLLSLREESASLKESLQAFMDKHILQPSEERDKGAGSSRKTKRGERQTTLDGIVTRQRTDKDLPNLAEILLRLVSRCMESPHDPYLSLEDIWPPHFQLLLRSGVVHRHPDNPSLIRITSFHH